MAKAVESNFVTKLVGFFSRTRVNGFAGFYPFTGKVYYRSGLGDYQKNIEAHELFHAQRMNEMGKFKWLYKYATSASFRENEEFLAEEAERKA